MKLTFDDGEVIDRELTLTAIGNGHYCGGGFMAAPISNLNDGLIDLCIINKITRLDFIKIVGQYKSGAFLNSPKAKHMFEYKQIPHFKMEFDTPMPICIDGEIYSAKDIDIEIIKNGFNFVIPKGCDFRHQSRHSDKEEN